MVLQYQTQQLSHPEQEIFSVVFELFRRTCIVISQLSESPLTTFPVVESPDEIFSYQAWSIIKRQRNFLFITCVLKVALERPAKVAAAQAKMAKA